MKKNTTLKYLLIGIGVFALYFIPGQAMAAGACASEGYTGQIAANASIINLTTPNFTNSAITLYKGDSGVYYSKTTPYYAINSNGELFKYNSNTKTYESKCTFGTSFINNNGTAKTSLGQTLNYDPTPVVSKSSSTTTTTTAPKITKKQSGTEWTTIFGTKCDSYSCWFQQIWAYALGIIVPLSTIMLIWAGILWSTSAGDPAKIEQAKKIITGVASGILLLVFARVLIVNVIGLDGGFWNVE